MNYAKLKIPTKYIDPLNIALILFTCALAHILPYHLLVFSYAVLGPAHYLTQISWLHDRRYFAGSTLLAPMLGLLSLLLVAAFFYSGNDGVVLPAVTLSVALGISLVFIMPANNFLRGSAMVAGALLILLVLHSAYLALFIAIMLPTVMHVFVFTAAFMWGGAMRSRKTSAYLSVLALLLCAGTFLIPGASETPPSLAGILFFKPVVVFLQNALGLSNNAETQLFGFLSFAYTYHYLNWFSKAEVIHWDKIPRRRMNAIVLIYIGALAIYSISYTLGFLVILLLAHMHVLMEFPLNMRTFAQIARRKI